MRHPSRPSRETTCSEPRSAELEELRHEVVSCRRCPRLVAWREQVATERRAAFSGEEYWGKPLPGFGDPAARIVLVGLAPAAHGANRTGRMFTGDRSGDWLFRALHKAGLASRPESISAGDGLRLRGAYVTAVVRCAPPANKPTATERAECTGYLERELALLRDAKVYLALGGFAFDALARLEGLSPRPAFGHGALAGLPGGRFLLGSYHPSQQNTFTGRLTEDMLDGAIARAVELGEIPG
ncbi:MAG: uracil-DNA glycosylase [Acidimicrobiales bacterium]|jgi:uracil-DNA glycosylase family 4|nr:uracil-DNA glycosylase [Actinomycetota bacterium]